MHSKVNPNDYSTISMTGVTRLLNGKEADFTELEQWITDYKHFRRLIEIKTFAKFRVWKAFSVWRRNVRWRCVCYCSLLKNLIIILFRKMEQCKQGLKENLFILHARLRPALLAIQDRCVANLKDKLMAAIESNTTYTLEEFKICHLVKLQLVS